MLELEARHYKAELEIGGHSARRIGSALDCLRIKGFGLWIFQARNIEFTNCKITRKSMSKMNEMMFLGWF